ncbi:hypothetical protein B0H66DRAFT_532780 [Apodospora peruviana]|uniref:NECAP PHear domain-containing protein n=1 Tax=Apodospora peruviana TaxID=516989 RepID=A0AAE0M4D1_9PEZI|nr:hypothetical protein B0H66DRAFT_532780 [Apodospora peruviana]
MDLTDPATGQPLPADAIQRILHIARQVHVYNIPPLTSTKGYTAAIWTEDPKRHIFTCRARVIETAVSSSSGGPDKIKVDIVLEDASAGQLFAAAPYVSPAVVEPALDSSRFFAVRVQDPAGRKATLGIGFEERSEAFDFSIALQEAQKALGLISRSAAAGTAPSAARNKKPGGENKEELKRDYSLKEGETITVNLSGTSFGRNRAQQQQKQDEQPAASLSSFALPPPPPPSGGSSSNWSVSPSTGSPFLPPPPSAKEIRSRKRQSAQDLGFDDGQFGEFA